MEDFARSASALLQTYVYFKPIWCLILSHSGISGNYSPITQKDPALVGITFEHCLWLLCLRTDDTLLSLWVTDTRLRLWAVDTLLCFWALDTLSCLWVLDTLLVGILHFSSACHHWESSFTRGLWNHSLLVGI